MEFDYLLESDSPDNAHLLDESFTTALPSHRTTDDNNDPISNIAESEIASQQALTEFDDLLESDSPDNAHPTDEIIITILPPDRITDNNDDPNSRSKVAENDIRSKLSEKSPDIEVVTLDQDQDHNQQKSNPEYVNRVQPEPDAEDTDPESLTTLANEMSIRPPTNGV